MYFIKSALILQGAMVLEIFTTNDYVQSHSKMGKPVTANPLDFTQARKIKEMFTSSFIKS